ncbi:MAG: cobalt transporter [Proteobacteria bacterium]|nr:cobalt transporter [Pseudomonadota bacterium]
MATTPPLRSSVPPGLIWAYRFREGGEPEALRDEEVPAALESLEGWLWLHFSLTDNRAREWIAHFERLPVKARTLFQQNDERLRIETDCDAIFGVFSDFNLEFDGGGEDYGRLRFAFSDHIVISARRHALRSVEETRQALARGKPMPAAANLIEAIVENFCDGAVNLITKLNDDLDHVEDHVVADRVEDERRHLVPIRRAAVGLHRQLTSLLGVFRPLVNKLPPGELKFQTDALALRLDGLARDLAALQDRARLLQDEISAKLAEATNRSLNLISMMTALMLPGTLITGLFGMNAGPVPFATTAGGFWWVLGICMMVTVIFILLLRRIGVRIS